MNTITTLKNKITLVHIHRPGTEVCKIAAYVDAGALKGEGEFPSGTAHFLEHLVFKGTDKYKNRSELLNTVLKDGGSRNAYTDYIGQVHHVSTLSDYVENALEYLGESLIRPRLGEKEFEAERSVIESEFRKNESIANKKFFIRGVIANNFQNENLKTYPLGDLESIQSITHQHVIDFYERYFKPENITIFYAGNLKNEKAALLIEKYFVIKDGLKTLHSLSAEDIKIKPNTDYREVVVMKGLNHTKISFSAYLENLSKRDYYSIVFLSAILSVGSNSRLIKRLRGDKGYTYSVRPNNLSLPNSFLFGATTEVEEKNIEETKNIMIEELNSLAKEGPSNEELITVIKDQHQSLARNMDSTESVINLHTSHMRKFNEVFNLEAEKEIINSVTDSDIQNMAKKVFENGISWIKTVDKQA